MLAENGSYYGFSSNKVESFSILEKLGLVKNKCLTSCSRKNKLSNVSYNTLPVGRAFMDEELACSLANFLSLSP